ncbi:MAG: TRAFs-binding domain-containing protein [Rhodoplanes sp.]
MVDRWLDFAPKPDALPAGKEWHVFLSYRSVNRPWVLALYDVLNVLGYKVFLDQYVLTAAAPLAIALGDALDASAGAVMIWSGSYEDSEWCKQEFAKLETMQNQKKGFRYVIARIDESEIAGLAATKLWIDFSKQREGPAGSGLLSLLYGLKGQPLPPAAVKLAAEVDAQMRDGLLSVKAACDAGDADALVALAETDDMAWTGSPMLICSVAEGLIAMKKTPEAIRVLDRVEAAFPKALRPKQLRGLALARSRQTIKAQLLLGKLYAAGEIDPETLGILARTWMDRYNQSGDQLFLLKSRDLYRQAFEAFPTDYYTGINAASKSLLAGEKETAAQLAARVQKVVGDKPVANDYWMTATAAELQLLQAKFPEAAALYRAAVVMAPGAKASHESTHAQAKLLSQALGASDEQRALMDAAFR